jgi:hypothetical protein
MDKSQAAPKFPVLKCPVCPRCGEAPPFLLPFLDHAFCPNSDCDVLAWNPWHSAEANLADESHVEVVEEFLDSTE